LRLFSNNVAIVDGNKFFVHELLSFLIYNMIEAAIGFLIGWGLTEIVMNRPQILRSMAGENIWFKLFTGRCYLYPQRFPGVVYGTNTTVRSNAKLKKK